MSYKLIISNKPISCTFMTSVTGITISGQQPTSTYRSLVFKAGSFAGGGGSGGGGLPSGYCFIYCNGVTNEDVTEVII